MFFFFCQNKYFKKLSLHFETFHFLNFLKVYLREFSTLKIFISGPYTIKKQHFNRSFSCSKEMHNNFASFKTVPFFYLLKYYMSYLVLNQAAWYTLSILSRLFACGVGGDFHNKLIALLSHGNNSFTCISII